MAERNSNEFRVSSFDFADFIVRRWKLFLITGILSFFISAGVSLLIKPMYLSTVTLYPSSSVTAGAPGLFDGANAAVGFGDEEATEKVLQILMADSISDFIAARYNLMEHYGISPDERFPSSKLKERMNKNISFRKTRFMSVEVNVLDREPEMAANMANDIAALIDSTFNWLLQEAGNKLLLVVESQYRQQSEVVKAYEDSLLTSVSEQTEGEGFLPLVMSGAGLGTTPGDRNLYTPRSLRFLQNYETAIADQSLLRKRYIEARMAASEQLPYTLVINRARIPERKAFPDRSSIVILSTLSVMLLLLIVTISLESLSIKDRD
jgi:uncharacterized protein involved in exopolysaccharide biosynthesis